LALQGLDCQPLLAGRRGKPESLNLRFRAFSMLAELKLRFATFVTGAAHPKERPGRDLRQGPTMSRYTAGPPKVS
jgi:hypothetical protein